MSRSNPFFNSTVASGLPLETEPVTAGEYRQLHWTKQLELRPLRDKKPWVKDPRPSDFDIRLDNWDDNEIIERTTHE